jgi:hypothetical protein
MRKKSVAIIGKGPSVKKCSKTFIDKFDTIVACGRPIFNNKYEKYIGNRVHYDYANRTSTPYTKEERKRLGIIRTIDTGSGSPVRESFKYKDLDPSTGILAFHEYVTNSEFDKISLIGFDLFQVDNRMYYFDNDEFDLSVKWLWEDGTYDKDGNLTKISGHNTELTYEYLMSMIDLYPEKMFHIISSYTFEKRKNLVLQ